MFSVEHVSTDSAGSNTNNGTTPNEKATARNQPLVTLKALPLEMNGQCFMLAAGMQSNAEILLGTGSVMECLLSLVLKAWHDAGPER